MQCCSVNIQCTCISETNTLVSMECIYHRGICILMFWSCSWDTAAEQQSLVLIHLYFVFVYAFVCVIVFLFVFVSVRTMCWHCADWRWDTAAEQQSFVLIYMCHRALAFMEEVEILACSQIIIQMFVIVGRTVNLRVTEKEVSGRENSLKSEILFWGWILCEALSGRFCTWSTMFYLSVSVQEKDNAMFQQCDDNKGTIWEHVQCIIEVHLQQSMKVQDQGAKCWYRSAICDAIRVKISFESTMVVGTTTVHLLVASQFIKGRWGGRSQNSLQQLRHSKGTTKHCFGSLATIKWQWQNIVLAWHQSLNTKLLLLLRHGQVK